MYVIVMHVMCCVCVYVYNRLFYRCDVITVGCRRFQRPN